MKLSWSHAVIYVKDESAMLDFYSNVLGFEVTDRGPMGNSGSDIIFMSQSPDEHHQIAMVPVRKDDNPSNSVNHFAFRTPAFEDLSALTGKLKEIDGIKFNPLSHGNTLSVYFNDPEGNGIEVFWDTPWHVAQPQGKPWDLAMDKDTALKWVENEFGEEPTFEPVGDYRDKRRQALGAD